MDHKFDKNGICPNHPHCTVEAPAVWEAPKCLVHTDKPKWGCAECKLQIDLGHSIENAARFDENRIKRFKAERRDKLEARIALAKEEVWVGGHKEPDGSYTPPHWATKGEGRRWQPVGFGCKSHKDKRCRCQEIARMEFQNPGERDGFIEEQQDEIKALGI